MSLWYCESCASVRGCPLNICPACGSAMWFATDGEIQQRRNHDLIAERERNGLCGFDGNLHPCPHHDPPPQYRPVAGDEIVTFEDGKRLEQFSGRIDVGSDIPGGGAT
jgi:hypothetical protein